MKTLKVILGIVACVILCAGVADAAPKRTPKPTVCAGDWEIFHGSQGTTLAVCLGDNGKNTVFQRYLVVEWETEDGTPASYLLGWK